MKAYLEVRRGKIKLQRGAAAVEFALIAWLFFALFLGVIEFGRFFYTFNTVQEITRCAAREAVVKRFTGWDQIKRQCVFSSQTSGTAVVPAAWEINNWDVNITFLDWNQDEISSPGTAEDNISACTPDPDTVIGSRNANCIKYVKVTVLNCDDSGENCNSAVKYEPMFGLFPWLFMDIPGSTVIMPAESLGYQM